MFLPQHYSQFVRGFGSVSGMTKLCLVVYCSLIVPLCIAVWFRYDLSPITVKYTVTRQPFYHFVTTVEYLLHLHGDEMLIV